MIIAMYFGAAALAEIGGGCDARTAEFHPLGQSTFFVVFTNRITMLFIYIYISTYSCKRKSSPQLNPADS